MRVTHVITRLIVGGAQENTIASVLGLRAKPGLEVNLISGPTTGPEGSLVESSGFKVHGSENPEPKTLNPELTIIPELVRPVHPLKDFIALRILEKIFRERRPDIVHTHSGKAGVLGRLAAARAGVPVIIHTIHGPSFGDFQNAAANLVFRAAERRAGHATTHFVTVADAMRDQYRAAGIGQAEQYTRIFSGFPRLFKRKGHDDLFAVGPELVRRNPRIKFLLVGDGAWRGRFENLARARGLEKHFVFTGLVPPAEIPALTGVMDILVHLSRREGLPRALPQALAAGKPIVAYDCDGAREVCRENETGFLVQPGDLSQFTTRLLQLAGDAALRERLGRSGQQFVRENFAVERMVDELHALYLRLARK
ncbi:MAG: glycosyltransferase [Verrucomicrobia bacterium]|nr:glycosyltransferase [Verrucomicrobiota bacterium]